MKRKYYTKKHYIYALRSDDKNCLRELNFILTVYQTFKTRLRKTTTSGYLNIQKVKFLGS